MTRACVVAVMMFLFDPSPSADVVGYDCLTNIRTMVPCSCVANRILPPCICPTLDAITCTVIPSSLPDATFEAHVAGDIPVGSMVFGCVEAVDATWLRSECVGERP